MKTILLQDCEIEVIPTQEIESIEKVLGLEFTGADHSDYIKAVQYDDGNNVWLWCTVEVKVTYKGILTSSNYLGCCAYTDEQSFKEDGSYEDMIATCLEDLNSQLQTLIK